MELSQDINGGPPTGAVRGPFVGVERLYRDKPLMSNLGTSIGLNTLCNYYKVRLIREIYSLYIHRHLE